MFDWVWILLWRTCDNSFCKVKSRKTLISMKLDSTREKIWRRTLLRKSVFWSYWKRKTLTGVFINLQLTENGRLLWPFPGNFHKILAENHYHCKQIRSDQMPSSVTDFKHCNNYLRYFKLERNYFQKVRRNEIRWKRESQATLILKYWKLAKKGHQNDRNFLPLWKTSIFHRFFIHRNYIENVTRNNADYWPSQLHGKSRSKWRRNLLRLMRRHIFDIN